MEKDKSKKIQFLSHELCNADRDIKASKNLLILPLATLNIYNGSSEGFNIQITEGLKKPLSEFLQDYFNAEKEKTYEMISNELKQH